MTTTSTCGCGASLTSIHMSLHRSFAQDHAVCRDQTAKIKELEASILPQADALQHYTTRALRAEARLEDLREQVAGLEDAIRKACEEAYPCIAESTGMDAFGVSRIFTELRATIKDKEGNCPVCDGTGHVKPWTGPTDSKEVGNADNQES